MSDTGDYGEEMFRRNHLDDTTIDQLLDGQHVAGQEALMAFVEDVQFVTSTPGVDPAPALTALFAEGFSTEKGDLSVTAASNVPGPASQAVGPPKWRKKNVIEIALAKLASLGLAAKIGVATGALALSGTAAAATGALPDAAQDRVADAVERAGISIPGGKSADHRQDADRRGDDADVDVAEVPAEADFGSGVADDATDGAPQEDGRQFGEDVSNDARDTHKPSDTPTAEQNPGTEHREIAPSGQPESTPTAEENPGTEFSGNAPSGQPESTPTAEDNPGTSRQP